MTRKLVYAWDRRERRLVYLSPMAESLVDPIEHMGVRKLLERVRRDGPYPGVEQCLEEAL